MVKTLHFHYREPRTPSLVRKLRSHMLRGELKKKKPHFLKMVKRQVMNSIECWMAKLEMRYDVKKISGD